MELLTCEQAAREDGSSPRYIRAEIQLGRLKAQKIGRDWLIARKEFNAWRTAKEQRKNGR